MRVCSSVSYTPTTPTATSTGSPTPDATCSPPSSRSCAGATRTSPALKGRRSCCGTTPAARLQTRDSPASTAAGRSTSPTSPPSLAPDSATANPCKNSAEPVRRSNDGSGRTTNRSRRRFGGDSNASPRRPVADTSEQDRLLRRRGFVVADVLCASHCLEPESGEVLELDGWDVVQCGVQPSGVE